jgi:hypothetical protein
MKQVKQVRHRRRKTSRRKQRLATALLVTVPEFAVISGVAEYRVRRMVAEDLLPYRLIGQRKFILREAGLRSLVEPAA